MKKLSFLSVLITLVLIFNGCKDECPACLNGGVCRDETCDCAPGFTGDNCETAVTLRLTQVEVTDIPFNNPENNGNWDEDNGPDVYFQLKDEGGNVLYTHETSAYSNLDGEDLPVTFTIAVPLQVTDLDMNLLVSFYDDDNGEDFLDFDDDFMGSVEFQISDYTDGANAYPTEVEKEESNINMTLEMQWGE